MSEDLWPGPLRALICLSELAREVEVCMACDCGQGSGREEGMRDMGALDSWMESLQEEAKEAASRGFHVTPGTPTSLLLGN